MKKLTLEEVKELVEKNSKCELLSKEFNGVREKNRNKM